MSTTPIAHTTAPTQFSCRSQLYRRHVNAHARFEELDGCAVVTGYADAGDEVHQATHLALADLSTLPRTGFKGTGARGWLEEHGAQLPNAPNQAARQEDGSLIARLSIDELLILSDLNSDATLPAILQDRWSLESTKRVYSLPRQDSHCRFALTGEHAPATLAKVCGVDMRTHMFAECAVAQTSLARVNAIILRNDLATTTCLCILSDVSSAEYLWDALLDAMVEFKGGVVGMAALRALAAAPA
jgi:sarcosine oxidase subunit gamma